jgi:molybdopterin/thiamine biosynthesis adenylyltransferase
MKEIHLKGDPETKWRRVPLQARLPRFVNAPPDAETRFATLRIGLVGVGSVGRSLALHLARLHPQRLVCVDPGKLKAESLLTHPCLPEDVWEPKASNLALYLKNLSPGTRVFACDGPVQSLDLTALADCDVVFLSTDNLLAEVETAQRCLWLGVPLIQASVEGSMLVAQIRVFLHQEALGPCLVCGFSRVEKRALNEETKFSCEGPDSRAAEAEGTHPPTRSLSALCSMAGDLAVLQFVRHRLGVGEPVGDSLLEYCGYTHRTVLSPLKRNPDCGCEHRRVPWITLHRTLLDCTMRELVREAGLGGEQGMAGISFRVGNRVFRELGSCACGQAQPLNRFHAPGEFLGRCSECGSDIRPQPFFSHDPVPASLVSGELDRPLREMTTAPVEYVWVRGPNHGAFLSDRHPEEGPS